MGGGSSKDYPSHPYNDFPENLPQYPSHPPSYQPTRGRSHQDQIQIIYSRISDEYSTLDQVAEALSQAGLESSNLIVGIDFTKSNEWTGRKTFNHKSLHHVGETPNPYEKAISIIGKTLSSFDDDNLIPCYGFGDATTHDQDVFGFYPDGRSCEGFEETLSRYRQITPTLKLAGPTSFAPIIEMAMTIVEESGGQYHVLLIIADGQVTRGVNIEPGHYSPQEQKTVEAIVQASKYPLSIVLVGVGDGPWDMMKEFDDHIPARSFDNFQFVNFSEIMLKHTTQAKKETDFALSALMEIPLQYRATLDLDLLGRPNGRSPGRVALPTPGKTFNHAQFYQLFSVQENLKQIGAPSSSHNICDNFDDQTCVICLNRSKNMAFGCGHQTCCECGSSIETCPICRTTIETKIKLY